MTGVALERWPTTGNTGRTSSFWGQQEAATSVPLFSVSARPARAPRSAGSSRARDRRRAPPREPLGVLATDEHLDGVAERVIEFRARRRRSRNESREATTPRRRRQRNAPYCGNYVRHGEGETLVRRLVLIVPAAAALACAGVVAAALPQGTQTDAPSQRATRHAGHERVGDDSAGELLRARAHVLPEPRRRPGLPRRRHVALQRPGHDGRGPRPVPDAGRRQPAHAGEGPLRVRHPHRPTEPRCT